MVEEEEEEEGAGWVGWVSLGWLVADATCGFFAPLVSPSPPFLLQLYLRQQRSQEEEEEQRRRWNFAGAPSRVAAAARAVHGWWLTSAPRRAGMLLAGPGNRPSMPRGPPAYPTPGAL